jgi:hypothetical protein
MKVIFTRPLGEHALYGNIVPDKEYSVRDDLGLVWVIDQAVAKPADGDAEALVAAEQRRREQAAREKADGEAREKAAAEQRSKDEQKLREEEARKRLELANAGQPAPPAAAAKPPAPKKTAGPAGKE